MKVLLAGGAGYIGTHTAVQLLKGGYEVVVVDNYDNSCPEAVKRAEELAGGKNALYAQSVLISLHILGKRLQLFKGIYFF